jgi:hypothetical protein
MKSSVVIPKFVLFVFSLTLTQFPAEATQYFDDFSNSLTNWVPEQGGWSFINPAPDVYFYRCDCTTNSTTWRLNTPIGTNWEFQADMHFRTLYGNGGTTGVGTLGLSKPTGTFSSKVAVNVTDDSSGNVLIQGQYNDGTFHTVIDSGWLPGAAPSYHVWIARPASNYFQVVALATNGFYFNATSPPIPVSALDQVAVPGFRVNGALVDFANMQADTPVTNVFLNNVQLPPVTNTNRHYLTMATAAANDLLTHWWIGGASAGQIANTWNGYTTNLPDARGGLWERGMFYFALDNLWRTTSNAVPQQMLASDWRRTEGIFTTNELQACGTGANNFAVDDAGWSSVMYLDAYDITGDQTALLCAEGIVNNAFSRWLDNQFGGSMWYSDAKQIKSLYQTAIVLSAFRIYQLTGDQTFYDRAMQCYTWMETYLLRSDNLYWVDYNSSGPVGQDRFNQIAETNSVVSLGGAFAMGLLHARLYHMTGDTNYLNRAVRTANAIYNSKLFTASGIYLDDRDAWTQGTFAGDWAREVLPLTGIEPKHWTALWKTADSIYTNDRTNGFYGGSWAGPAEGPGSAWWLNGSVPEQITTSSSSACMIMAAAALEREYANRIVPRIQILPPSSATIAVRTFGQPFWQYQLQSSTDLINWNAVTNFYPDPVLTSIDVNSTISSSPTFFRAAPLVQP